MFGTRAYMQCRRVFLLWSGEDGAASGLGLQAKGILQSNSGRDYLRAQGT